METKEYVVAKIKDKKLLLLINFDNLKSDKYAKSLVIISKIKKAVFSEKKF